MGYNGKLLEEIDGFENFSQESINFLKAIGVKSEGDLPNWYGIPGIKFIYHNEWTDPEIFYNGKRYPTHMIEDTMWYDWTHDPDGMFLPEREKDQDGFASFMHNSRDLIIEYLEEEA